MIFWIRPVPRSKQNGFLQGTVVPHRIENHFLSLVSVLLAESARDLCVVVQQLYVPEVGAPNDRVKSCVSVGLNVVVEVSGPSNHLFLDVAAHLELVLDGHFFHDLVYPLELLLVLRVSNDRVSNSHTVYFFIVIIALRSRGQPVVLAHPGPHGVAHGTPGVVVNEAKAEKDGTKGLGDDAFLVPHKDKECFLH